MIKVTFWPFADSLHICNFNSTATIMEYLDLNTYTKPYFHNKLNKLKSCIFFICLEFNKRIRKNQKYSNEKWTFINSLQVSNTIWITSKRKYFHLLKHISFFKFNVLYVLYECVCVCVLYMCEWVLFAYLPNKKKRTFSF